MKEIWQTTNQQPWVNALADGIISIKTRTTAPIVPLGAVVLLHSSKTSFWPHWKGLKWAKDLDVLSMPRGVVQAIAIVDKVDLTQELMTKKEYKFWNVDYVDRQGNHIRYDSSAEFAVRFKNIIKLKKPVFVKGFQSPFARAKKKTIEEVTRLNPSLRSILKG